MSDLSKQLILGVEGGATKTHWALCEMTPHGPRVVLEGRLGPGSMRLSNANGLRALLAELPRQVDTAGVFLAGCATEADRAQLRALAAEAWPRARLRVGSDRESGFAAALRAEDGIAVIAGTGSAVTGRHGGTFEQAGGWGHLLGDTGAGYDLAIRGLRQVLFEYDTAQKMGGLARDVLETLGLGTLRELTMWSQTAHKSELARLTPLVFRHADERAIHTILQDGAMALAELTAAVAARLELRAPRVCLMGGVFVNEELYQRLYTAALGEMCPEARVAVCKTDGCLGAAFLAAEKAEAPPEKDEATGSLTEEMNPRSAGLDQKTTEEIVRLFVDEEGEVQQALRHEVRPLAAAVELTARALGNGGRLFYVGAGTSGRIGMLDASEMPPTFGVDPELVQGVMAGGEKAFFRSVEGAEDAREAGAAAMRERGVTERDVVCGIAASGRTPYVLGAMAEARAIGAGTIFLTCNPQRDRSERHAKVEIDLPTGPEVVTGSTRLKAGTATKVALNIISTTAMVRLGRVDGNLMSCLRASNEKLRERAVRIVTAQLKISADEAKERLECTNWNIREALAGKATGASDAPNGSSDSASKR